MRTATLFAALALASAATAQIPLPSFGNTFTAAGLSRGFWFQAPTTFVITGLSVPNEAGQAFQAIEVIDLGGAPPPNYPATVVGTQLFYSNSSAAGTVVPTNLVIQQGAYIGVIGVCTATVGGTTCYNSYASTPGAFQSNINGVPVTLTRFGTQFAIGAAGNNPCWTEPGGQLSRVDVYVGPANGFASAQPFGTGCINVPDVSSYELFASGAFDLSNTGISLFHTGTGYLALPGTTTYVAPSATAQTLTLGDDTETTVALSVPMRVGASSFTNQLTVCSNGFVSAAGGNGTTYTPIPTTFLNGPAAWWALAWHDFNPGIAGSGQVKFEEVNGVAYVTWDGVWDYAGTSTANANTFQAQFELATGTVHYVYQQMSNLGIGYLTGFSDAGASADPGSIDISAQLPASYTAATFAVVPLAHAASARPVIGTSISLDTTRAPAGSVLGLNILGLSEFNPGLDLTSLGMPSCSLYASLDATPSFLPVNGAGSVTLPIPANNSLAGLVIISQGAMFAPGINAFGFVTSNAVRLTLDLL